MLSAIIVNYRSSYLVDDCLRSLYGGSVVPDETIIIDNEAVGREEPAELAHQEGIRVHAESGNPGYSVSCNAGVRLASGDELLFLNADVTLARDCLADCLGVLRSAGDIGIVTPRLVLPDGRLDHACHRGLPTPLAAAAHKLKLNRLAPRSRALARYTMTWLDPLTEHDIEACTGAFMLMPRAVLDAAGGWDERYGFYADDLDLCIRVAQAGKRVRYVGTTTATHLKGAHSFQRRPDRELAAEQLANKQRIRREIAASHELFYDEHLAAGSGRVTRGVMAALFALQRFRLDLSERRART